MSGGESRVFTSPAIGTLAIAANAIRPGRGLTREWGTPTREADDGGKRILIYDEIEQAHGTEFQKQVTARQAGTADAAAAANAAVQGGKTYARSYLFWLDDAGKITQAQIRQR